VLEDFRRPRDECLNKDWFISLNHARDIIQTWRVDHSQVRLHGSLAGLIPMESVPVNSGLRFKVVLRKG